MVDLDKYIEIFTILNLVVVTSILFTTFMLYTVYRNKQFLYLIIMYFSEVFLLINKTDKNIYKYLIICILVKIIFIGTVRLHFKIKKRFYSLLILIGLMGIFTLIIKSRYNIFLCVSLNIIVVKIFITDYIKNYEIEAKKYKNKFTSNKKNISEIINEIDLACELQNQYKNEVLDLNYEINKTIDESNNLIFIMNFNKQCIYYNEKFRKFMNIKEYKSDIDIFYYLNLKFINSNEILDCVKSLDLSRTIKSYEGKIYKFECLRDTINKDYVNICVLTDITESTLIKNKLKESEERYKKLMDILNDGVIIHSMNSINYINQKAISLLNINENNLSIEDITKNINYKSRKNFINNINLVLIGKKEKISTKIETNEGKIIEFITTNIILNNNKLLLSIAIDITNLENIITDLEQSEKTYKLLLQTLPEGVVIIDKNTNNYIYRNKAMIKILKTIGAENLNNIIKKYLNKGEYGNFKQFSTNSNKIKDINIAIIELNEDNAFLVVARTLDDKYKTEKMKEVLDEISNKCRFKTEFLANVANDIKKPINTIFETNKILYINKDKYDSDYIDNYTRLVKQNCYRLMRLLDNVQQIGHLENGTYKMDIKKYDIVKLIEDIVNKSIRYTDEKGLSIIFESNVAEKIITLDKEKIEKIVLNLLSNSIKFTNSGGSIKVLLESENDEISISIIDTGEGIPEDKIDIVFESFEQVDRTLSRGAEGSGIGLSLVKKLVDVQNAKIVVKSEVNKGSEFKIILKDNLYTKNLLKRIESGCNFSDNEKIDIEFSDIYFNYSY
ncbi:MAG: ATP-binding protein [Romboutsia sp.]|uniref:PAS domain-containing sensor histidine kinase n=1 Tax=Romboutsia sp. TaxID=1965302 RepID=UPI003F333A49